MSTNANEAAEAAMVADMLAHYGLTDRGKMVIDHDIVWQKAWYAGANYEAAAIQRGDGQTKPDSFIRMDGDVEVHDMVKRTPPAAKPAETSGATLEISEPLPKWLRRLRAFLNEVYGMSFPQLDAAAGRMETIESELEMFRLTDLAELAAVRKSAGAEEWQAIETAPKDGTRILCSYHGNRCFIARWRSDFSVFMDDWDSWRDATHWRPLPNPSAAHQDGAGKAGV